MGSIASASAIASKRICGGRQSRTLTCIRSGFVRISGGGAGFGTNLVRSAEKDDETRIENSYSQTDNCPSNGSQIGLVMLMKDEDT